jgi:hypothetical protein
LQVLVGFNGSTAPLAGAALGFDLSPSLTRHEIAGDAYLSSCAARLPLCGATPPPGG